MAENRPVGILDSGIGGLTVLKQALKQLPNENYIFIGDQKNMPYGSRPKEEIIELTRNMVNFLILKGVKAIVFACNTATAEALDSLKEEVNIPLIGVIKSGSKAAIETDANTVGLIATEGTVKSGKYETELKNLKPSVDVISLATPKFVPMIESGNFDKEVLEESLSYFNDKKIETLILGCTHYPIIKKEISNYFNNSIEIVDPSFNTVKLLQEKLQNENILGNSVGKSEFYTTGNASDFSDSVKKLLDIDVTAHTVKLGD